jgi:hypothetical protein
MANGVESVTGSDGTLQLTAGAACVPLEISAPGFLQRRTCAKSSITLWPVADAAEEAATRQAVFLFRDQLIDQVAYAKEYGFMFGTALNERADVLAAWNEAADIIRASTSGRLSIPFVKSLPDEGYLVSPADMPSSCRHSWFTWTFAAAGFCWEPTNQYFLINVTVAAEGHQPHRRGSSRAVVLILASSAPAPRTHERDQPGI